MSTGRVQGPSLKIIVDREKEIKAFVPKPFWQIRMDANFKQQKMEAWHVQDKFWDKKEAEKSIAKTKSQKEANADEVERRKFDQMPPFPFDLTSLQIEAYRCFGISPKETLSIAQELYTSSFISYPRTSSQQLPESIGYKKIFDGLGKQAKYAASVKLLTAKKSLKPNNGKKTDPAHPALYPTGIAPNELEAKEAKIYDIIVKRFMATFAENAVRETMTVDLNCNNEIFITRGTRTIEKGWHKFYEPYVKLEEIELPDLRQGQKVNIGKI